MPNSSKFSEIAKLIEDRLTEDKKTNAPMHINIWDLHKSPNAHNIFADKEINNAAKEFGNVKYFIEDVSAKYSNKIKNTYPYMNEERIQKLSETTKISGMEWIKNLLDFHKQSLMPSNQAISTVTFFDPREKNVEEILEKHGILKSNRDYDFIKANCENAVIHNNLDFKFSNKYDVKLSSEQMKNLLKEINASFLLGKNFDTSAVDEEAANFIKNNSSKQDVIFTIYGYAHWDKKNDLSEKLPGLSIVIADDYSITDLRNLLLSNQYKNTHNQLPEYVYYADEKKLVQLDSDKSKAELLGLNEQQFSRWKSGEETFSNPMQKTNHQKTMKIANKFKVEHQDLTHYKHQENIMIEDIVTSEIKKANKHPRSI